MSCVEGLNFSGLSFHAQGQIYDMAQCQGAHALLVIAIKIYSGDLFSSWSFFGRIMQGKSGEDLSASEVLSLRTVKSAKRDVNLALSIRSIFL